MAAPNSAGDKSKAKAAKPGKAACEAAGWKFAPIARIGMMPSTLNGRTTYRRYRSEGGRGTMAIPPAGSGMEPRQFAGSGLAVRWVVEQLGEIAKQPDEAPAGMEGVRLLLSAALASGEVCTGPDETPERPDAQLLSVCRDMIEGKKAEAARRAAMYSGYDRARDRAESDSLTDAMKAQRDAATALATLHATTREGLLQKARAAIAVETGGANYITSAMAADLFKSLAVDLIHLVPTIIDQRGRLIVPRAGDAEGVA